MTIEEAIYRLRNAAWLGTEEEVARNEEAVEMAVDALEKQWWIPVSKMLPNKSGVYLVSESDGKVEQAYISVKYKEFYSDGAEEYIDNVTAWMPLPEPYKGEEN